VIRLPSDTGSLAARHWYGPVLGGHPPTAAPAGRSASTTPTWTPAATAPTPSSA